MSKKIMFIIVAYFLILTNIYAECDNATLLRLKKIATNVNLSYEYRMNMNDASFKITINNLTNELYLSDDTTSSIYYYYNTNFGELSIDNYYGYNKVKYTIYAADSKCYGKKLLTKYYSLPVYNKYYVSEECKGLENFSLCKKWVVSSIDESTFLKRIKEYKTIKEENNKKENTVIVAENSVFDKIMSFYSNYYYFILGGIIIICSFVIFYQNRKNKFKL